MRFFSLVVFYVMYTPRAVISFSNAADISDGAKAVHTPLFFSPSVSAHSSGTPAPTLVVRVGPGRRPARAGLDPVGQVPGPGRRRSSAGQTAVRSWSNAGQAEGAGQTAVRSWSNAGQTEGIPGPDPWTASARCGPLGGGWVEGRHKALVKHWANAKSTGQALVKRGPLDLLGQVRAVEGPGGHGAVGGRWCSGGGGGGERAGMFGGRGESDQRFECLVSLFKKSSLRFKSSSAGRKALIMRWVRAGFEPRALVYLPSRFATSARWPVDNFCHLLP